MAAHLMIHLTEAGTPGVGLPAVAGNACEHSGGGGSRGEGGGGYVGAGGGGGTRPCYVGCPQCDTA
jgi:hypothetical protein